MTEKINRLKLYIIVLIIFAVAIAASYFLWNTYQKQSFQNNNSAATTEIPNNFTQFQSASLGYSFWYPMSMTGGTQPLTEALRAVGVRESVVLQTAPTAVDRMAILVSVEEPKEIDRGVSALADVYEKAVRAKKLPLERVSSRELITDNTKVLERVYISQNANITNNVVRFAVRGSRLYIFSLLRKSQNPAVIDQEKTTLDSLRFF